MDVLIANKPVAFQALSFPKTLRVLVLAPHPDDLDAIGVTARFLLANENPLYAVVVTSGASGVEDSYVSTPTAAAKSEIREQEQLASCRFLGLPETSLRFLRLEEDETGQLADNQTNTDEVRRQIQNEKPGMVFLPHGNDTNLGHQRVYAMFRQAAQEAGFPMVAFLNRDPKTIQMQCDVYLSFDDTTAAWKAELLRHHQSQHQRNLNLRGYGFDDRILGMNQHSARVCCVDAPYAEVFELEHFRTSGFEAVLGS
jgi:LmbE family N-acetylglucosaminyl deacetylase